MRQFAATPVAAGPIRAAILRLGEARAESEGRERDDAEDNFRDSFHGNSPFLN
jgi:hypothetical protein